MSDSMPATSLSQRIQNFLFTEEVPYGFALLRITLPVVLLEGVLARWRFCEELFSTNGVNISLMENFGHANLLRPLPPFWAACLMSILVVSLCTTMIGFYTRTSLVISLLLHTYFACNDMATSMTKFTVIETHVLLLLALSGCGKIWSVDRWLASRRDNDAAPLVSRPAWALTPRWPHFLMFMMIGATYLGAAITKIHMPDFITGDAISYWIMSNPNFRHSIGEFMTQYPGLLIISSHFTVLWETLFIFLAWPGPARKYIFALGYMFHIMAALTLGEVTFLMVISCCYLGMMTEDEAVSIGQILTRFKAGVGRFISLPGMRTPQLVQRGFDGFARVSPVVRGAMLATLFVTVGLGGAFANRQLDLYGVRRPEGPYELQTISHEEVSRLFAAQQPIREIDKYLGVRLGSIKVGGRLSNNCDEFRYNDNLVCEASLNPPHEDMWIECHLLDESNKIVHRDGVVCSRESRWAQFTYKMTEVLEPGQYSIVIRSRNQEICRRPFTLHGERTAVVAN